MLFKFKDSRGRESTTLSFVLLSWLAGTGAFIYSLVTDHPYGLTDYGLFVGAVLAIWLGREWTEKKVSNV